MDNEVRKVLELLEAGKITTDEAVQLMNAIKDTKATNTASDTFFRNEVDSFLNATSKVVESIKDVVTDAFYFNETGSLKKEFTKEIQGNINTLNLKGKNSSVAVEVYDGETIIVSTEYIPKYDFQGVEFESENGVYNLVYDNEKVKYMKIKAKIPNNIVIENIDFATKNASITCYGLHFKNATLTTKNSKIDLRTLNGDNLIAETKNSKIEISNSTIKTITGNSGNAKIELDAVTSKEVYLTTSNGKIAIMDCSINKIDCQTSNGEIKIDDLTQVGGEGTENTIKAVTYNHSIKIGFKNLSQGINLKAKTSLGDIKVKNQNFKTTKEVSHLESVVEGQTYNYESANSKTDIVAETSKGNIYIV